MHKETQFETLLNAPVGFGLVCLGLSAKSTHAPPLDANMAFCRMVGYTQQELLATAWADIAPGLCGLESGAKALSTREHGYSKADVRLRHKLGRDVWARFTVVLVRDAEGQPDHRIAIVEEIADPRRPEQDSAERERQFQLLIENVASAIALVDEAGRFRLYNARFLQLFDLAPGADIHNVNSQDWSKWEVFDAKGRLLHVDDHPARKAALERKSVDNQLVGVRLPRGGELIWMLVSAAPLLRDDGTIENLICTYHDITDLKHAEETLRRREATLAQAGQMAHLGAWEIEVHHPENLNLDPLSWSDEVYRIFGFEPGAVAVSNQLFLECVHPEDRERVLYELRMAMQAKRPYSVEHRIVRSDGSERIVQEHAELVFDDQGTLAHVIGAVQDVTDRKQAEQALIELNQRKNEFLAVLSHELRNPLAPIRNSVYILERVVSSGEQAKRAIGVIDRQAQHMTRLVEDLLDITRISRGKINLQRERIDLGALVRRTAEDHRELFSRNEIELRVAVSPEPLWLYGDSTRLAQVIGNLLSNSAKFTPRGGTATLTVDPTAHNEALIRVHDNGSGLSQDTLGRVFEPFVQAAQTLERTRGGLGLGLALAKGLVEMHGGRISARSDGEGRGAEFTVALPLDPATLEQTKYPPEADCCPSARRVLVIEDNVDAADSLREALEVGNHEVLVARTGPEGVEAARRLKPDAILCDIGLPGLDGYGVAQALRADPDPALRSVLMVAVTGYALQEDIARSKEAGFDHHIAKPPKMDTIERLLAATTRGRHTGPAEGQRT
ncbi:MAG TPA: PAS domain S-box protein [Polyangiaceae bacterium]|nr:PAS domain S-box protein [Polyangiaceae bacterium]